VISQSITNYKQCW